MEVEVVQSNSSELQEAPSPPQDRKLGGWRAIKYILGNESFERLASMSLIANMTVYLHNKYNIGGVMNVNVSTIWSGSSNLATFGGAFLADGYLGRFLTLLFGTMSSLLGMTAMTLTAGLPLMRPGACNEEMECPQPTKWQLAFLFTSLGFLSLGAGGIRPCGIAFGADQFDTTTAEGKAQLATFFNWWYLSFTIALIIALTGVVYVQTNISWTLGFAITTACLFIAIVLFLIGRHTYICKKPKGSIFADMAKVLTAACRKRGLKIRPDSTPSYYDIPADNESGSTVTRLAHTDRFKFLDKAAIIVDPSELDNQGMPKNGWRLCSLQQVEQLKSLIAVLPVWVSGVGCLIAMDQQNTFGMLQAIQANRHLGSHFQIPPGWMSLTSMISLSVWIFIYECIYTPVAKRLTQKDKRLTMKGRINVGIIMSILCMSVAAFMEKKRRDSALKHGTFVSPVSISFLFPQFVFSGLTEAFAAVAIMEYFTTQMPESMRTIAGAVFFISLSIASYASTLIVNIIHKVTSTNSKAPWLGDHDLNKNRLDYYYYIIAALEVCNFIYFNLFASRYVSTTGAGDGTQDEPKDDQER